MDVIVDRDQFLKGLGMVQNIVEPRQTLPILANVLLETGTAGLLRDSVVMVSHLRTLDKATLVEKCGRVSRSRMAQIDAGLRRVLDLPG